MFSLRARCLTSVRLAGVALPERALAGVPTSCSSTKSGAISASNACGSVVAPEVLVRSAALFADFAADFLDDLFAAFLADCDRFLAGMIPT
jgi:hypothetical protein